VRLETDTVNTDTSSSQVGDEDGGVGGLGAGPFDVVVVVEELDGQVVGLDDLLGLLEGEGDVVRADGVVPDVGGPWVGCGWAVG